MIVRRARLTSVLLLLVVGSLLLISSTQTWFVVVLRESPDTPLQVSGSAAMPVLAPLALAALALAAATSIAGRVLAYPAAFLAIVLGAALTLLVWTPASGNTLSAVAPTVTEATGIAGPDAVGVLIRRVDATPWPLITVVLSVLLVLVGVFAAVTAHTWRRTGRRYRTESAGTAGAYAGTGRAGSGSSGEPLDAIDTWDDLSQGSDPTH